MVNVTDSFIALLGQIPDFDKYLVAGVMVFARILAFFVTAPVFSRKDIPIMIKISFALLLTFCLTGNLQDYAFPKNASMFVCIVLNIVSGALMGYVANIILYVVESAGEMINMQMGLQAAVMFDSGASSQTSIMGRMFNYLGIVIYAEIGGLYWLFSAFQKGFQIFPLYATVIPLDKIVNLNYVTMLTSNVLLVGFQIASPILIATLCQDIILGIISKVAPQVNVFQLSFVFKPAVGAIIFILIIPLLVNSITDYLAYYSNIF